LFLYICIYNQTIILKDAFNRPAVNSNSNLINNNAQNSISNQSAILNNLLSINNKKSTNASSTPTPSKTKPNEGYFMNNQEKSLNQNVKVMNPPNNSSLRTNLNNLIGNSNPKNLPHQISTGNLVGNAENRNSSNFNLASKSSNNYPRSAYENNMNTNQNQAGFVTKFINSYK